MSVNSQVKSVPGSVPDTAFRRSGTPKTVRSSRIKSYRDPSERKTLAEAQMENSLMNEWSVSTWVWIILVPVIVYIILLLIVPTFVTKNQNGVSQVDHQQVILWTLIISVIIWILLWGLNYCKSC